MALPVSYEMKYVLSLWLGTTIPDYTLVFSILILVIALIDVINPQITTVIYATGRNGMYNVLTSIAGLLVLPLSYVLLKKGASPVAVYWSSIIISVLVQVISILCLRRETKVSVRYYLKTVILPCIIVVLMTIWIPFPIVKYVEESFMRLIYVVSASIISVLLVVYFFGLSKNERFIVTLLKKKIKPGIKD